MHAGSTRRLAGLLIAAALSGLVAWSLTIPAFEGPDESAFYNGLISYARGAAPVGLPLYAAMMKPALVLGGAGGGTLQVRYNPSFRFVSNRWGRVNRFMHGRAEMTRRDDRNRLRLLRAFSVLMWAAALLLVFDAARMFEASAERGFLAAMLALSLPQLSFFASVVHEEATSALLGAVAYWTLTARVFGRIGRWTTWTIAIAAMALSPFSDRQAYFILLLVPVGLVVSERSWKRAAIAAGALLAPLALLGRLGPFAALRSDAATWLAPMLPGYRAGWWNPDTPQYLAFEFLPKMFFGFFGWIGQPSILLPAPVFAGCAVFVAVSAAGLLMVRSRPPLSADQRRAASIFAWGVFVTIAPIVYFNILIARNSWYGRWLFPSIAPIVIGLAFGCRTFCAAAAKRPHRAAAALAAVAAVLELLWVTPPGAAIEAGIRANHYGDQARVLATVGDSILLLGFLGIAIEAAAWASSALARVRSWPVIVGVVVWSSNLVLLAFFVRPLYQPLDAQGFATMIREEVAGGEYARAGGLYRIALGAYPASGELRQVATESPIILMAGADDRLLAELQARLARGDRVSSRAELLALARAARTTGSIDRTALAEVIEANARIVAEAELRAEPLELMRAEMAARLADRSLAADVVRAGGGTMVRANVHGDAVIEGFTAHRLSDGYEDVIIYFRPLRPWAGRRVWIHAYPDDRGSYIALDPSSPAFDGWKVGELSWEAFRVPPGCTSYVGVAIGDELGTAIALGRVEAAAQFARQ